MAKIITGLAIIPRVSRNGIFYWPQELAKFDNTFIPLRFNHIKGQEGVVGNAKLRFDAEKMQVLYTAEITNPEVQTLVDNHNFQVSLGARVETPGEICHPDGTCFNAPILKAPTEMSIVETPGMPESTLNIVEHNEEIVREDVHTFYIIDDNTSNNTNKEKDLNMAEKSSEKVEEKTKITIETDGVVITPTAEVKDTSTEVQHPDECPPGQHKVDGKCVPQGEPAESKDVKKEDCGCNHAAPEQAVPAPVGCTA